MGRFYVITLEDPHYPPRPIRMKTVAGCQLEPIQCCGICIQTETDREGMQVRQLRGSTSKLWHLH